MMLIIGGLHPFGHAEDGEDEKPKFLGSLVKSVLESALDIRLTDRRHDPVYRREVPL
jgi:hypothetical protein